MKHNKSQIYGSQSSQTASLGTLHHYFPLFFQEYSFTFLGFIYEYEQLKIIKYGFSVKYVYNICSSYPLIIILPKNMQNLPRLLILALLVLAAFTQLCSLTQDPSLLLQAGTIQIINPYTGGTPSANRLHSYSVSISYAVLSYQVASSIRNYNFNSQFSNAWDFSVRGGPGATSSTAQIIVFITDDWTWTSLQVSYLISSRSDLFLGSFIADGYIFQSSNSNQLTLNYVIPNWQSTNGQVIAVTEFSGIRTFLSQSLSLSFVSTTISGQSGLLKALVSTNSPFELLYLTYYWWIVGANDITFSTFNVNDGSTLAYPFAGIDAINGLQVTYAGSGFNRVGLLSCADSKCPSQCVTVAVCNSLGGIVSGTACTFCGPNSQWNGNTCVCNANFYPIGGVCSSCPTNSIWDGTKCVCITGYYMINGNCVTCPDFSTYIPSQQACVCLSGYYMVNNVCIACPANSAWDGKACVCLSGFFLINGVCSQCPVNSIWNGTACNCIAKYYLINGVCSQCPAKSTWNGTACACNNNKLAMINGVCTQCKARQISNGTACNCDSGFYLINGVCSQCQANSAWSGSACVCLTGFYPSGKNCLACPANSVWNGTACSCVTGYYLINNVCTTCPVNQVWNGASCVCVANYYLIGGVCQACPADTTWDGSACIPICPTKSVWDGYQCVCQPDYYKIQGTCLPCDPNSVYDGQTCVCQAGFFGNYQLCTPCDSSCVTCSQAGPNGCTSCPAGITVNAQGACLAGCGAGKVSTNGVCINCPNSCVKCSDPNTCTECAPGYTLLQQIVNGNSVIGCTVQGPPSPGSKIALTGIVVGNNVIYQGLTISSLPTSFLVDNCASCSDLFTILVIPNNLGITYTVQYVLYSQYWFIVTFNFGSSAITPNFQFKIQLNFKYANLFTSADMAQGLINSVSPLQYPTTPAPAPAPAPALPISGGIPAPKSSPVAAGIRISGAPTLTVNTPPTPAADPTRPVVGNGVIKEVSQKDIVSLFG